MSEPRDPLRDVFAMREPPTGGLRRLRERLEAERRRRRARWLAASTALGLAAAAAIALIVGDADRATDRGARLCAGWVAQPDPALVSLGLAAAPPPGVSVAADARDRIAVQRVTDSDDDVVYYRLASLERE
ncbi:MAG: hypothetical protein AB7S26_39035 [Sandaracinaceae bacterium]